jgi:hypothetical protein
MSEMVLVPHLKSVTAVEAEEATELPTSFVAITVNVYVVPFVNPDTFIGEEVPVTGEVAGLEVTV